MWAGVAKRKPNTPAHVRRRLGKLFRASFPWDLDLQRYLNEPVASEYNWAKPADVPRLQRAGLNPYFDFWQAADGGYFNAFSFRHCNRIPSMFQDVEKLNRAIPWGSRSGSMHEQHVNAGTATSLARSYAINFFSWAVPRLKALQAIADLDQPVYEVGSGRGYWAWMLEQMGVRMVCEEPMARRWYWRSPNHERPRIVPRDHALMLCWPEANQHWTYRCLRRYQGSTVIFMGERGPITGNEAFHNLLDTAFTEHQDVGLAQWRGLHDNMWIFKR